jgi:hypothetical protein
MQGAVGGFRAVGDLGVGELPVADRLVGENGRRITARRKRRLGGVALVSGQGLAELSCVGRSETHLAAFGVEPERLAGGESLGAVRTVNAGRGDLDHADERVDFTRPGLIGPQAKGRSQVNEAPVGHVDRESDRLFGNLGGERATAKAGTAGRLDFQDAWAGHHDLGPAVERELRHALHQMQRAAGQSRAWRGGKRGAGPEAAGRSRDRGYRLTAERGWLSLGGDRCRPAE